MARPSTGWKRSATSSTAPHVDPTGEDLDDIDHQLARQHRAGHLRGSRHARMRARPDASPGRSARRAQRLLGDINPKLATLTDDVLFGDVWARPGLSPRDRSLVTVSALIAMNRPDQLRSHLQRARDNGLTEQELIEAITHLAFYAGWPSAVTASTVARGSVPPEMRKNKALRC